MQRNIFAGFVLIFIMSLLVGGATAAYFSDDIPLPSMADFVMGEADVEVKRVPEPGQDGVEIRLSSDTAEAKWVITNTGSVDVLLRAKIIEDYTDEIDKAISRNSTSIRYRVEVPGVAPTQVSDGWDKGDDGYFYYSESVESGCTVEFNMEFAVDGSWWGKGEVGIEVEAVQASNLPPGRDWPENTLTE